MDFSDASVKALLRLPPHAVAPPHPSSATSHPYKPKWPFNTPRVLAERASGVFFAGNSSWEVAVASKEIPLESVRRTYGGASRARQVLIKAAHDAAVGWRRRRRHLREVTRRGVYECHHRVLHSSRRYAARATLPASERRPLAGRLSTARRGRSARVGATRTAQVNNVGNPVYLWMFRNLGGVCSQAVKVSFFFSPIVDVTSYLSGKHWTSAYWLRLLVRLQSYS